MIFIIDKKTYSSREEAITISMRSEEKEWLIRFLQDIECENNHEIMFTIDKSIGKIPSTLL